jgi:transglutaminase-like putative cysteine protease
VSTVRYAVRHETLYHYDREVAHSHQQLHLTPRSCERQRCVEHSIQITPQPSVRCEFVDAFGNRVTRLELDRPHDRLRVVADMQVSLAAQPELDARQGEAWERVRDQLCYSARPRDEDWLEAMRFRGESPYVRIKRVFGDFARDCLSPGASVLTVAEALMAKVHREFVYAPGATEIATPLMEVFGKRSGVCQDFAHFMIASLRSTGLAARYVSGYLRTHAPAAVAPEPPATAAPRLQGADASHAWVAVFAPPFGWVQFDPTNNLCVNQEHIALAWGRDFGDVSPLRGVILGGGSHALSVRVNVQRLAEPALTTQSGSLA